MSTPGSLPGPSLQELGERGLIARIRDRLPAPPPHLVIGIGDDAAVAIPERGALQILTTDGLVEGVHFDWDFSSPADVGFKALAVNLSDIAAMGGTPRLALLSLALPASFSVSRFDGLLDGFLELSKASGVALAGGNISRSPGPLVIDVTVVGSARPRKVLTRSGGRPGDALFVTGTLGAAAAGLGWLRAHGKTPVRLPDHMKVCVDRFRRPVPRTRLGGLLGRMRAASACIDLSDGLAEAVRQLAEASGTGARLEAARLPLEPGAREWFGGTGVDPVDASLGGGEDYELLFAARPKRSGRLREVSRLAAGVPLTRIGELMAGPDLVLERDGTGTALPAGFRHF